MCKFIKEENLKGAFRYLDNITIARHNEPDYDTNVASFLDAVRRKNITLNESKTKRSVESINILGYVAGNNVIKPDPKRMRFLQDFPVPNIRNALRRVLGMLAHYAKWINSFANKVRPLANTKNFLLFSSALDAFELLKRELRKSSLQSIDESLPFAVECDASDAAILATLNQGGPQLPLCLKPCGGGKNTTPLLKKRPPYF